MSLTLDRQRSTEYTWFFCQIIASTGLDFQEKTWGQLVALVTMSAAVTMLSSEVETPWSNNSLRFVAYHSLLYILYVFFFFTSFIFMAFNIPKVMWVMCDGVTCYFQLLPAPVQIRQVHNNWDGFCYKLKLCLMATATWRFNLNDH